MHKGQEKEPEEEKKDAKGGEKNFNFWANEIKLVRTNIKKMKTKNKKQTRGGGS